MKMINIISLGINIILTACGAGFGFSGETLTIFDEAVFSAYVTSIPTNARLKLLTMDRGVGAGMSTAFSPNTIYYVELPSCNSYLQVSHPGYKSKIVRLNPDETKIHIELEKEAEAIQACEGLVSFSKAFAFSENLPDISYVAGETAIPDLINEALIQGPASKVECANGEYSNAESYKTSFFNNKNKHMELSKK